MPSEGFETAIPAIKRPQSYALDHTATGIGHFLLVSEEFKSILLRQLDATLNTLTDLNEYLHTTLNLP
jgi:hypothetical protein